jgi:hypothetical protein
VVPLSLVYELSPHHNLKNTAPERSLIMHSLLFLILEPGDYLFNCSRQWNDTKVGPVGCLRKGGAHSQDSSRVIVTISILLLLLIIRTIT